MADKDEPENYKMEFLDYKNKPIVKDEYGLRKLFPLQEKFDKKEVNQSESASVASTVVECICDGKVTDNVQVIACDMCSIWYHRKCSGLLMR